MTKHRVRCHAAATVNLPGYINCTICKMGFIDVGRFVAHFRTNYGHGINADNVNAESLKRQGLLWTPGLSLIKVNAKKTSQPTHVELYFQHIKSIVQREDHAIFVFRQSSRQPDFHGEYLQMITKIAARAAVALQGSRVNIASAAVVSSFLTRPRLIPSFPYHPSIEMKPVLHRNFEGSSTAANDIWLGPLCQNAAKATFNLAE